MKRITLVAVLFLFMTIGSQAQTIAGTYEQSSAIYPTGISESHNDLVITQDPKSTKKIWISNLGNNEKIYALVFVKGDEETVYNIPEQKVGKYMIKLGCVTHQRKENNIAIAINNKKMCFGISQKDYDGGVSVGANGKIKAGGMEVGTKGVKGNGVKIAAGSVNVDTKAIMGGLQYVGHKVGTKVIESDD
jgi:hypothetical protein